MNNDEVFVTAHCYENGGKCVEPWEKVSGASVSLEVTYDNADYTHASQLNGKPIREIEFLVRGPQPNAVVLEIFDMPTAVSFLPQRGYVRSELNNRSVFTFDVPNSNEPDFAWEIPNGTPGRPLTVVVKKRG